MSAKYAPMHKLALIVALAALYGCGGARTDAGPLGEPVGDGNWFCESAPDGENWDCIQDPELARTPRPTRSAEPMLELGTSAPSSEPQVQADSMAPDETVRDLGAVADGEPISEPAFVPTTSQSPTPEAGLAEPVETPATVEPPGIAPTVALAAAEAKSEQTNILDLPADHYAVQLLAMASAAQLQNFIAKHQLPSTITARVERNGGLYYVLLLGVYDTLEGARQASLDLPAPLDTSEPWIRPLGSLQNAIARGNALAIGTD